MNSKWAAYIRRYEGFSVMPYQCPGGHWTIGYGHNLEGGISKEAAEFILQEDIARCVREVQQSFSWWYSLTPARQFVLVDMVFNMGLSGVKKFKKMLAACAAGEYEKAAAEMLDSAWARQVGRRALQDAEMMKKGQF